MIDPTNNYDIIHNSQHKNLLTRVSPDSTASGDPKKLDTPKNSTTVHDQPSVKTTTQQQEQKTPSNGSTSTRAGARLAPRRKRGPSSARRTSPLAFPGRPQTQPASASTEHASCQTTTKKRGQEHTGGGVKYEDVRPAPSSNLITYFKHQFNRDGGTATARGRTRIVHNFSADG